MLSMLQPELRPGGATWYTAPQSCDASGTCSLSCTHCLQIRLMRTSLKSHSGHVKPHQLTILEALSVLGAILGRPGRRITGCTANRSSTHHSQ